MKIIKNPLFGSGPKNQVSSAQASIPLENIIRAEFKKDGIFDPNFYVLIHLEDSDPLVFEGSSKEECVSFIKKCNAAI
jgi:hypothetical protein